MTYMPQEIEVWYVIPAIRKELAKAMKKKGLKQQEIATNLGLTVPAVSQYITGKRGKDVDFGKDIKAEIVVAADNIIENRRIMVPEIQRICSLVKKEGLLCKIAKKYHELPEDCKYCMEC